MLRNKKRLYWHMWFSCLVGIRLLIICNNFNIDLLDEEMIKITKSLTTCCRAAFSCNGLRCLTRGTQRRNTSYCSADNLAVVTWAELAWALIPFVTMAIYHTSADAALSCKGYKEEKKKYSRMSREIQVRIDYRTSFWNHFIFIGFAKERRISAQVSDDGQLVIDFCFVGKNRWDWNTG